MSVYRPKGVLSNDAKYASDARVHTVAEMLQYSKTWVSPPHPEFSFEHLMEEARKQLEPKEVEKLEMSEAGFHVTDTANLKEEDKAVRQMQSVLNRLTEKNYDVLIASCLLPEALEPEVIDVWVARIFSKALEEPMFCPLYAKMAFDVAKYELHTNSKKAVRTSIVKRAQEVYEQDRQQLIEVTRMEEHMRKKGQSNGANQISEEEQAAADKLRKKKLANIKLIGELYKFGLLVDRIILTIVSDVLHQGPRPAEVDVEMCAALLKAVGSLLESKPNIEKVYEVVQSLADVKPAYCNRIRFELLNLLELRKNGWKDKRQANREATSSPPANQPTHQTVIAGSSGKKSEGNSPVSDGTPPLPVKKALSFTPLPPQLASTSERAIESQLKSASLDQHNLQEKVQSCVRGLRGLEQNGVRDAVIVCQAAQYACTLSQTQETIAESIYQTFTMKGIWEKDEVAHGLAWCVTVAIVDMLTEDTPKFFPRMAKFLATSGWGLDRVVADVFGKAQWCLDSVFESQEGDSTWHELYIDFWEMALKEFVAAKTNGGLPFSPAQVMDALGGIKPTGFFQNCIDDMLPALTSSGVCTEQDIKKWRGGKSAANATILCGCIDLMF